MRLFFPDPVDGGTPAQNPPVNPPTPAPPATPAVAPAPPPAATVVTHGTKTERETNLEAELEAERKIRKDREIRLSMVDDENRRLKTVIPPQPARKKASFLDDLTWHS